MEFFIVFREMSTEAQKIIDLGFLLGIGGVVTYKNSNLNQVLQKVDVNNLVLETDAPYLAPDPKRGSRNESSLFGLCCAKTGRNISITHKRNCRNNHCKRTQIVRNLINCGQIQPFLWYQKKE
jgi:Tat protein secretion system quality control protein TatD with DNase activity